MEEGNSIELGSTKVPEVLHTLASLLPQCESDNLESQLQNFDNFLEILAPSVRPEIAGLLKDAASKTDSLPKRERILAAAVAIERGGRAAEPYDHAAAMQSYQQSFQASYADMPKPAFSGEQSAKQTVHARLLAQLDQIEAEMKRIGFWSNQPPDLQAAVERGEIKSYLDAPSFELWLQAIFLPRAKNGVEKDELPKDSQVGEMARRQYDYMSIAPEAEQLLRLLNQFDELIREAAAKK